LKFKFFQELEPGVQKKLTGIVKNMSVSKGKVLFRQADPPKNCYVILEGQVGVYVRQDADGKEPESRHGTPRNGFPNPTLLLSLVSNAQNRDRRHSAAELKSGKEPLMPTKAMTSTIQSRRTSVASRRSSVAAEGRLDSPPATRRRSSLTGMPGYLGRRRSSIIALPPPVEEEIKIVRYKTEEGFSFYHEHSDLGPRVAILTAGSLFGELALLNEEGRNASIQCIDDCRFLAISWQDFDEVLKADMSQKKAEMIEFMKSHIPGMRDLRMPRGGRPHASYFFRKETFARGHVFLTQGSPAETAFYLVCKGAVEFLYREPAGLNQSRPATHPGSAHSRPSSAALAGSREAKTSNSMLQSHHVGVVVSGGFFGSIPTGGDEPFTVRVAVSPCVVYMVMNDEIHKLPLRLLNSMTEYLVHSTTWRLKRFLNTTCLRPSSAGGAKFGRATSMPDLRSENGDATPAKARSHETSKVTKSNACLQSKCGLALPVGLLHSQSLSYEEHATHRTLRRGRRPSPKSGELAVPGKRPMSTKNRSMSVQVWQGKLGTVQSGGC